MTQNQSASAHKANGAGIVTTASVGEVMEGRNIFDPGIESRVPGSRIVGRAVTCSTLAGQNLLIHHALREAEPGDVLVITAIGDGATGLWGGLISHAAKAKGIAGVVVDGAVRDVRDMNILQFPVWSRSVSPRGAGKANFGEINGVVICGGVAVSPGDLIVADDDGVVAIPSSHVDRVLTAARERDIREESIAKRLDDGESTLAVFGLPG